ncbi:MAG: hypothetical protein HZC37_27825 [Burkholderiales bacterium]|nr:hypothetical protein [Burkholderiales bacterium]
MISMKWVAVGLTLLLAAWATVGLLGRWQWSRAAHELERGLEAARRAPDVARYDPRELEDLPAPVQRYFRAALTPGQPIVAAATIEHTGQFNLGEAQDNWKPFTSHQRIVATRPGFVWNARIAFVPGLAMRVLDASVAGAGRLHAAVAGLVTVAEAKDTPDLAEGELMRFFAEAAWVPTALLPSQGVHWEAVDEHSARATMSDGALSVTLTFGFAADGTLESVQALSRGRTVAGRTVPTPWEGRWSNPQTHSGMRVPMTGEVAWLTPEGRRAYWRGTITSVSYEFAR